MDISNIARSGLTAATTSLAVNANNVANAQTADYASRRAELQDQKAGGVQVAAVQDRGRTPAPGTSSVDYAEEITEAMSAKNLAAAQTRVLDTQQQMLGAILDMRA